MSDARIRKRWRYPLPQDPRTREALQSALGISPLLATLLVGRGIDDPAAAGAFLSPALEQFHDPALLAGLPKAVDRLSLAIRDRERITVFGDYDVDGVSSTALLVNFLKAVGADVDYYIPHRMREGYGLSMEGIEKALTAGTRVIITVDNGVAHPEEVARAQAGGIDVIVTDHHRIPDGGNPAYAIVNPHQEGCEYPYKILAGAGIALNLAMGLRRALRDAGHFDGIRTEPNLREFLDLAALGTIADLVPLRDVNRVIATFGVEQIRRTKWTGLRALLGLLDRDLDQLSAGDVAFQIAPRINAGGRLSDAADAVELLTTSDGTKARMIASVLDKHNEERRKLEQEMVEEAVTRIERDRLLDGRESIVLWQEGWHPGVIGIVAARLVERYHRPTIVVGVIDGEGKGSARSIRHYNIYEGIKSASTHLEQFGGHAQAAGLTVRPENLEAFARDLDANAREWIKPEHRTPELRIDAVGGPELLTEQAADDIARMAPFGMENPEPVLGLRGARLSNLRALKERHLKGALETPGGPLEVIGFGLCEDEPLETHRTRAATPEGLDLAGSLEFNHWRGRRKLQFRVKDLRPWSAEDPATS